MKRKIKIYRLSMTEEQKAEVRKAIEDMEEFPEQTGLIIGQFYESMNVPFGFVTAEEFFIQALKFLYQKWVYKIFGVDKRKAITS